MTRLSSSAARRPSVTGRPNRILLVVLAVIAVLAVVAGVYAATRPATEYARGTPEGVVQAYLNAVIDGDHQEAAGFLATGSPCGVDDLDRSFVPDGVRVVLLDTAVDGDTAQVEVDVVMSSGGPFDASEQAEKHTFRLTRSSGDWLISGIPWPMFDCGKVG